VATPKALSHDIGDFIRDLRQNARISLRQLAEQAGVSNPYLSQIERGLRKPSAEVLQQLATALRVSTPIMYLRAGLLDLKDGQGVLAAIASDAELTEIQKQTLTQIYDTFRRENARDAEDASPTDPTVAARTAPHVPAEAAEPSVTRAATTTRRTGRPAKSGSSAPTPKPKNVTEVARATEKE
jgi:transcriptional regulator with XRE-family HTH domain